MEVSVARSLHNCRGVKEQSKLPIGASWLFHVMREGEDNVLSAVNVLFNALQPQQKKDIISAVGQDEEVKAHPARRRQARQKELTIRE